VLRDVYKDDDMCEWLQKKSTSLMANFFENLSYEKAAYYEGKQHEKNCFIICCSFNFNESLCSVESPSER
jgi:hypothetical protein